jgi:hypothetical protein
MLRPTVSLFCQPPIHLRPKTRFLLLSDSCGFVAVRRHLWREDGSVVYNCCWISPAQSSSSPIPTRLMTIFYCLRFETPPPWRARSPYLYPSGKGCLSYTPRHWVPFSSPHTNHRLRRRYWIPPPRRGATGTQSQSASYFTIGGLAPISSSWRQVP